MDKELTAALLLLCGVLMSFGGSILASQPKPKSWE